MATSKQEVSNSSSGDSFDQFLWWLSTAEYELIHNCAVDRNRYRITGFIVLCTWLFATLAWTYFFSTAISSPYAYVPLGIFMGFIILCIDRALIKGINKANKNKLVPLLFRGVLALTIGLFMAQPAVLYLFDKEIKMQASIDNEKRKILKRQQLDSLYAGQKTALQNQIGGLKQEMETHYQGVDKARINFISEADGSGGTGKVGISVIALAKKNEYLKLDSSYRLLQQNYQPQIDSLQSLLAKIETEKKDQEKQFEQLLNNGFLTRIEALQNLIAANDAVAFRYRLIIAILMLIELMPVIAKMMLPSGPYEDKIILTEQAEKDRTRLNLDREDALKAYFNDQATEADKRIVQEFFEINHHRRIEKMDEMGEHWRKDKYQSFDKFWDKIKREVMSRQEG